MNEFAHHLSSVYFGVFLQLVTAVVIVMLGVAMYGTAGRTNQMTAAIALSLYLFEAVLLAVSQIFVFGFAEVSRLYVSSEDPALFPLGEILLSVRDFTALTAIIPFGIGAVFFYSLLMKAAIIPKWLARWGMITVSFVLVGATFMAFRVAVPLVLVIPYVPFEFFTGIYIWTKYRK